MDLKKINNITYSIMGQSVVLHIDGDYDYYVNGDKRNEMIEYILTLREALGCKTITLGLSNSIDLMDYVKIRTMEREPKKPKTQKTINCSKFRALVAEGFDLEDTTYERAQTLITKSGKPVEGDDFKKIKVQGTGGFAKVYQVLKRDTNKLFAMKELNKLDYIKSDSIDSLVNEQKIMAETSHPYLMTLDYCFHTQKKLYFVMDYMPGGEQYAHLKLHKRFKEEEAKYIFAQVVLGIKFLHKKNVIYRDQKPENIFLDADGYLKVGDFGISKQLKFDGEATATFVGTPEYFAPELLSKKPYNKQIDCWALGIFLYELLVGHSPFKDRSYEGVCQNIQYKKVLFPSKLDLSRKVIDLIIKLLKKDPNERIGHKEGIKDIMNHVWFNDLKWHDVYNKNFVSPIKPEVKKEHGIAYKSQKTLVEDQEDLTKRDELMIEGYEDVFDDQYFEKNDDSFD